MSPLISGTRIGKFLETDSRIEVTRVWGSRTGDLSV